MSQDCFIIAIDGPSGAGKSSTSKMVAERLGLAYLDSGALYRAVGLAVLESEVDLADEAELARLLAKTEIELFDGGRRARLNGRDVTDLIRTERVSAAASRTSTMDAVRRRLLELQRSAARPPGLVAEGRDMGSVVFPDAELKVFLDADPDERARRRAFERGQGDEHSLETIARDMAERDSRDRSRLLAPLRPAPDAVVLNSTAMLLEEVVEWVIAEAKRRKSFE